MDEENKNEESHAIATLGCEVNSARATRNILMQIGYVKTVLYMKN